MYTISMTACAGGWCTVTLSTDNCTPYLGDVRGMDEEIRAHMARNAKASQAVQRALRPRVPVPQLPTGRHVAASLPRRAPPARYAYYQGNF